jgi:hypothetical protein
VSTTVRVVFVTDGGRFEGRLPGDSVFHEALERLLPEAMRVGRRVTIRTRSGDPVYPDMFVGETEAHFATDEFVVRCEPLRDGTRPWRSLAIDHIALAVRDRADARRLLEHGLGFTVVRDDVHQTVVTTGLSSIFLFDAEPGPLNPGVPSRVHHLGVVVDDLDAAWQHVRAQGFASDYMVLERDERWSLYFFYENGEARFMIQLSEIKPEQRGIESPERFTGRMFDYGRQRYGVRFDGPPGRGDDSARNGNG